MLILTLGDPLSVTIECLLAERQYWADQPHHTVVLLGSWAQWQLQNASYSGPAIRFRVIQTWAEIRGAGLYFYDIGPSGQAIDPRQLSVLERGQLAVRALNTLRTLPASEQSLAVLTGPIDKASAAKAGFAFPGQTEFFEDLWGDHGIMILAGERLRVGLATNHLPLAAVSASITGERVERKTRLLLETMQKVFGIKTPRIAVAALNPHAGDGGLFGSEDQRVLTPALDLLRAEAHQISGPLPADTVFFRAYSGEFDAVLAMYHDQGLAPLKALHFYDAVNITGGLRHLRISPDHGPAADLYGLSRARSDSFRMALDKIHTYLRW